MLVFVLLEIMCKYISNVSISVASFTSVRKVPEPLHFFFKICHTEMAKNAFFFWNFAHWHQNTLWIEMRPLCIMYCKDRRRGTNNPREAPINFHNSQQKTSSKKFPKNIFVLIMRKKYKIGPPNEKWNKNNCNLGFIT